MKSVIVLAGGSSDEREVSLRSGRAVAAALSNDYSVTILDPADGLEEIVGQLTSTDVVFPALHGTGGEDGTIQRFLESHSITYVGSDSSASALCFDKYNYGSLLSEKQYLVPQAELVDYDNYKNSRLATKPYVLKPNDGGSSIDTYIVREISLAPMQQIQSAFAQHGQLLLQELIVGQEITVAVLGNEALPVIEIIAPEGQEFDYDNKYNGATQELCPPRNVATEHQAEAQRLAIEIHDLTGCRDMSRTDFIITPQGEIYTLETNTIPGLTDQSLLPKAAATAGYTMAELCSKLVESALSRG